MSRGSRPWRALVFLLGAAAALMLGCGPTADTQQAQADESALRGMVANDQQQIDALQQKVQRLDDRIAELQHNGPAAGSSQDVGALEKRVAKLESETSSAQTPGAAPTPGAGTPEGSEEAAVPGGAAAATAGSAGAGSEGSTAASSDTGSSVPPASGPSWRTLLDQEITASHNDPAAKLYRAGLIDLKAGKYEQALAQFQTLQRRYPKSSLSEPAEFFSANALYEMGKYDQSILQFNDQTMRFPKGPFASAALLREAQAFVKINDRIDARLTLQKLLNDLPDSPEAPMAKSMMQTLAS